MNTVQIYSPPRPNRWQRVQKRVRRFYHRPTGLIPAFLRLALPMLSVAAVVFVVYLMLIVAISQAPMSAR